MSAVSTLQSLCAQLIVQNNLVVHPVNTKHIPHTIYEDLWNLRALKSVYMREMYLIKKIDIIEDLLDEVEEGAEFYEDVWMVVSEDLTALNAPDLYETNPPSAPPMMFFRLYQKVQNLKEIVGTLDKWVDRKWDQVYVNDGEKEKYLQVYGNVIFNVDAPTLDDEVDREYEDKVDTLIERNRRNPIAIHIQE